MEKETGCPEVQKQQVWTELNVFTPNFLGVIWQALIGFPSTTHVFTKPYNKLADLLVVNDEAYGM